METKYIFSKAITILTERHLQFVHTETKRRLKRSKEKVQKKKLFVSDKHHFAIVD